MRSVLVWLLVFSLFFVLGCVSTGPDQTPSDVVSGTNPYAAGPFAAPWEQALPGDPGYERPSEPIEQPALPSNPTEPVQPSPSPENVLPGQPALVVEFSNGSAAYYSSDFAPHWSLDSVLFDVVSNQTIALDAQIRIQKPDGPLVGSGTETVFLQAGTQTKQLGNLSVDFDSPGLYLFDVSFLDGGNTVGTLSFSALVGAKSVPVQPAVEITLSNPYVEQRNKDSPNTSCGVEGSYQVDALVKNTGNTDVFGHFVLEGYLNNQLMDSMDWDAVSLILNGSEEQYQSLVESGFSPEPFGACVIGNDFEIIVRFVTEDGQELASESASTLVQAQ